MPVGIRQKKQHGEEEKHHDAPNDGLTEQPFGRVAFAAAYSQGIHRVLVTDCQGKACHGQRIAETRPQGKVAAQVSDSPTEQG
jgi:hypothetical protein